MPDSNGSGNGGGFFRAGQSTKESVGGWQEIQIAIRDTLILSLVAALHSAFVLPLTLIAGPWALLVVVPWAVEEAVRWLRDRDDLDRWHNTDRAGIAALVAVALLLVQDAALIWWPWRWQASRESWWGVMWPARFPAVVPVVVLLRAVTLRALVSAWAPVHHLVQRLIGEIRVPTLSGAAYASPNVHDVQIDGWDNPHLDPDAIEEQEEPESANRGVPFRTSRTPFPAATEAAGTGQHGHNLPAPEPLALQADDITAMDAFEGWEEERYIETEPDDPLLVEFPASLFLAGKVGAAEWADLTLARLDAGSRQVSANAMHPHYTSEPKSRELARWLEDRGYVESIPGNRRLLTDDGADLLEEVAAGRCREGPPL
jgi:hypothetical protein